jgi:hypothetical protein
LTGGRSIVPSPEKNDGALVTSELSEILAGVRNEGLIAIGLILKKKEKKRRRRPGTLRIETIECFTYLPKNLL